MMNGKEMKISHRIKKMRNNVAHLGNRIDELEAKRKTKVEELQNVCHHEFISECCDGGQYWKGRRICEICCLEEEYAGIGYKILKTDRVRKVNLDVLWDLRRMRSEI